MASFLSSEFEIAEAVRTELGDELVVWGDDMRARFDCGIDSTSLDCGVVILPRSLADVQATVKWCAKHDVSIVVHGGRTGLTGATSTRPGQVILDMRRMKSPPEIDAASGNAMVSVATTLAELEEACEPHGLHPGIEIGSRGSCSIGGLISTNAGGAEVFRYGMMRQRVLGLQAVLADGSLLTDMPHVKKSNMGIDVKQLFIGSEGTLGILIKAILRLERRSSHVRTLMIAFDSWETAVNTVSDLRDLAGVSIAKADMMPWREFAMKSLAVDSHICLDLAKAALTNVNGEAAADIGRDLAIQDLKSPVFVIAEFESMIEPEEGVIWPELLEKLTVDGFVDAIFPKNEKERAELWTVRDEWATDNIYPYCIDFDLSVPLSALPELMRFLNDAPQKIGLDAQLFYVGHLLDGNVHIDYYSEHDPKEKASEMTDLVMKKVQDLKGSFSAEHGIGTEKRELLDRYGDKGTVGLMKTIKSAMDPKSILNPGKIL